MASGAELNMDLLDRGAGGKAIAASASHFGVGMIYWMNVFFHSNKKEISLLKSLSYRGLLSR
jgi:hypothetical protein